MPTAAGPFSVATSSLGGRGRCRRRSFLTIIYVGNDLAEPIVSPHTGTDVYLLVRNSYGANTSQSEAGCPKPCKVFIVRGGTRY